MILTQYNYNIKYNRDKLIEFLKESDLNFDENIDYCLVMKENNEIVGCACKKANVFKMIAVSPKMQSQDCVATLISGLIEQCHKENIFHYFIFTKMIYQHHFEGIGFKLLTSYKEIGLFEMGSINFDGYYNLVDIKHNCVTGSLVMNCNPFTLGHKYVIEQARKQCDQLIIFIVEEDLSFFPFSDRIQLVKEGTKDLDNIYVIGSGPYIISSATFPTYFLKSLDDQAEYYTHIDINMFVKIMEKLHISKRFVGTEPLDQLTAYYNETMKEVLKDHLQIIPRVEVEGQPISASRVRQLLEVKDFPKIKELVPQSTYDYLVEKFS